MVEKIVKKTSNNKIYFDDKNFFIRSLKNTDINNNYLNWFKKKNILFKYVCCIYPTSAMVKSIDLKESFKLVKNMKWSFVMSAQKYTTQIERSFKLLNKRIVLNDKKKFIKNSQTFQDFYHDAGQFYWGTSKSWYSKNTISSNKSTIYELKKYQAVDINTLEDWKFAEKLYKLSN